MLISSRQCGAGCVFRIVEHTNYHLSSILTDSGYGLEKCGVVGECDGNHVNIDAGLDCAKRLYRKVPCDEAERGRPQDGGADHQPVPRQGNFNLPGMGAEKNGRAAFGLSAVLQIFGRGYPVMTGTM